VGQTENQSLSDRQTNKQGRAEGETNIHKNVRVYKQTDIHKSITDRQTDVWTHPGGQADRTEE